MSLKLENDKYYTPIYVASKCIKETFNTLSDKNITEIIEPSAGNGSFSDQIEKCIAYDIEPENRGIIKQDFLSLELPYKEGRLIIGNPPFGSRNNLSVQFFRKSIEIADFIAFIQPISQLNNNQQMYHFDLIKSIDLGRVLFSDKRTIHCCFNIWKRPDNGVLNGPPKKTLEGIELKEIRKSRDQYLPEKWEYDIGLCTWGSVGKEIEYEGQFNQELYIKVKDSDKKEVVVKALREADWLGMYPMTKSPRLKQWQVIKFLSELFKEKGWS